MVDSYRAHRKYVLMQWRKDGMDINRRNWPPEENFDKNNEIAASNKRNLNTNRFASNQYHIFETTLYTQKYHNETYRAECSSDFGCGKV